MKKFEFNNLSKEEKYSTLIILMKYLMPLVNSGKKIINKFNNATDNDNFKYHYLKDNKLIFNDRLKKLIRKRNLLRNNSSDFIGNINAFKGRIPFKDFPSITKRSKHIKLNDNTFNSYSCTSLIYN